MTSSAGDSEALDRGEHLHQRALEVVDVLGPGALGQVRGEGLGQQLGHQVAVGGDQAGQHVGLRRQVVGVGQVAVVGQAEAGTPHAAEDGLGVDPVTRAGGGVAGVADGQVAPQARELALVEHRRHEAHVLHHGDEVAVAHGHAGRLLATVLQGVEPVEGQVCDRPPRGIDPEDSTRFLGLHHRFVTAHTGGRRTGWSRSCSEARRPRNPL